MKKIGLMILIIGFATSIYGCGGNTDDNISGNTEGNIGGNIGGNIEGNIEEVDQTEKDDFSNYKYYCSNPIDITGLCFAPYFSLEEEELSQGIKALQMTDENTGSCLAKDFWGRVGNIEFHSDGKYCILGEWFAEADTVLNFTFYDGELDSVSYIANINVESDDSMTITEDIDDFDYLCKKLI